jgi:hypothetical protein
MRPLSWLACGWCAASSLGCRDLSSFSSGGGSYEGAVVQADFVRAGVDPSSRLCMTLDMAHVQDVPGRMSTNDHRFQAVPFRPIPQIWHDPLSTLSFGDGRLRNLLYVAGASVPFADGTGNDVFVVVSLMQSGRVEVRLLRGAPDFAADTGARASIFAIFDLSRQDTPCSY